MGIGILAIAVLVLIVMQTILRDNNKKHRRKTAKYRGDDTAGFIAATGTPWMQDSAHYEGDRNLDLHHGSHSHTGSGSGHSWNDSCSHSSTDASGDCSSGGSD